MVKVKEVQDKQIWENFVSNWSGANFLQSWNWGEFHLAMGQVIRRTGFYNGGELVGVMLAIVEKGKRATYLTVPAGPLIDWNNTEIVEKFMEEIRRIALAHSCSFVRVRPQIINSKENTDLFKKLGFVIAPMHLHAQLTLKLDLAKTPDQLLTEMRKATRYEVRQAIKMGIKVEETVDLKEMEAFYDLQLKTANRQAFVPFGKKYLLEQFKVFAADDQVRLYTAKFEDRILAQAMVIFYGQEADYHYGASSEDGRKYPGVYLIQWTVIQEAKKRGLKYYDLWGIAPEDGKNHRFYGVSLFKRGFGGFEVEYVHARDLVISKSKYMLNLIVERTRKHLRRL